jgi:predicted acetyltransferase
MAAYNQPPIASECGGAECAGEIPTSAEQEPGLIGRAMEQTMEVKTFDKGRSHFREVVVAGGAASWLTVIDYRMRIGSGQVKMGAISYVHTKSKYRMKGYMRALMQDTVRYMSHRRYAVSMVSGISDFYYRFGYASCLPDYELSVFTRNAERAAREAKPRRKYRTRKFRPGDGDKLLAIYNANTDGQTCSLVRQPEYFARYPKSYQQILVIEDARRRAAAYAVCNRSADRLHVHELAADSPDAMPALGGSLAALAVKRRLGRFTVSLAPGHPFGRFCQRYGCRWSTTYHRNASAMMRIVDQQRLFEALAVSFRRRLRHSRFASSSAGLCFKTELGATTVAIRKGSVRVAASRAGRTVINLSQADLAQLVAGYRTARDALTDAGRRVGPKAEPLLEVLFPKQTAVIWDRSRFEELALEPHDFPLGK